MENTKPKFWKSLNQYNQKPSSVESAHHEFVKGVTDDFDVNALPDKSRRKFIALMGASTALAATACSDYYDKGEIITYNKKPASITYGQANHYATSLNNGTGVLVKTREGRPIKIDGNPEHPVGKGKISTIDQAAILDLYDPSRLRFPIKKSDSKLVLYKDDMPRSDWEKVDNQIVEKLKKAAQDGKEIAIVTHSVTSPTQNKLFNDFVQKYPTAKIYSYDQINDSQKRQAWVDSYGSSSIPSTKWNEADVILSFECDFLGSEGNVVEQIAQFSSRRDMDNPEGFNKLYQIEGNYSLTGAMSDYRIRLTPENHYAFIMSIAAEINSKGKSAYSNESLASVLSGYNLKNFAQQNGINQKVLDELLKDIMAHGSKTLAVAGILQPKQVHVAVNLLNEVLGSVRNIYDFNHNEELQRPISTNDELNNLVSGLNSGNISVLIHFDSNPVYHFPTDLGYADAYKKAPTIISMVESANESCEANQYIIPINHALESWGDFNQRTGIFSLQQPVIAPIHDTRQKEAVLLNWMNDDPLLYSQDIYHKFLMNHWETVIYPMSNAVAGFREFWFACLHDGIATIQYENTGELSFNFNSVVSNKFAFSKQGFTVILKPSYYIGDGRFANNGWLQEVPNPVTKTVWDNYAMMSPATAKELNVTYGEDEHNRNADMVEVSVNGKTLKLPVMIQPGMAEKVIAVDLGYGRTTIGDVGKNIGFNAGLLLSAKGGVSPWIYTGASVTKTEGTYELVSTQEHHALDEDYVKDFHFKRHIINEYTVPFYKEFKQKYTAAKVRLKAEHAGDEEAYKKALKSEKIHLLGHHEYKTHSITPDKVYTDVKWAMAIDLNKCTACGSCVTACNVENNIPIVGKEEASKGREMHWMRIDTYFSGTPDEPITSFQPMLCQHCDNAPCENVCPVVATTHSPDGLNQMTYNRCVGTRYCANNCPYKVRRYNFFDFRNDFADGYYRKDTLELLHNPEVTVRSRGVMEKCTFCTQRIQEARTEASKQGRKIKGTDVVTACQDACPASAITFGDMNDPESKVSKLREHPLGYHVLETISVKPNVTYISKLRNIVAEEKHGEH
ncbi:MAG: 4Fe-4S dicluster domain-containing protein [Candidatus Kapabacteria bacterium]|nr:4Fe-4S dicluster domain-containing protein [Ignavibacteriota bacterium]MCW5885323.1 4Fe-4S dicluster domain-containing protein [Candidatus Kapabacteria bacterium]